MTPYLKIIIYSVAEIAFTCFFFNFYKKKSEGWKSEEGKSQGLKWAIIIGIIYGIIAVCGTEFGIQYNGFYVNIRDAAPLIAGLYFNPLSGIIAGFIGGIERWFAVYWGLGYYTRLACTLGTIFAGLFGAFIKKFILEGKTPSWIYALTMGGVTEVFHLILIFSTNRNDAQGALEVITIVAPIMIPMVAVTVSGLAFISTLTRKEQRSRGKTIADDIQKLLFASVIVAFLVANAYVVMSQKHLAYNTAGNVLSQSIKDLEYDVENSGYTGDELGKYIGADTEHWHIGTTGYFMTVRKGSDEIIATSFLEEEKPFDKTGSYYYSHVINNYEEKTLYYTQYNKEYPMYFEYVTIEDYVIIGVYPGDEANLGKNFSIVITAFMEILILAFLFIQIYFVIKKIVVSNIQKINASLARITSGNLDTVVDVRTNDEFTSLSEDINNTVLTLKSYIDEAEKRIDTELQFAKDIQESSLPTRFPVDNYYDIYGNMKPAKSVGGDFYDFYQLPFNKLGILIADVSGKGIPAALFMMKSKTLIKSLVEAGADPADVLARANDELCLDDTSGMFVTAWLGILDCNTGKLVFANAGHNPPVIARNNGDVNYLKSKRGLVLAGMEGSVYYINEIDMEKGDGLILYTDGVTEACNIDTEMYGEDRLLSIINRTNAVNMRYLCKVIKGDVDEFVGEAPQFDDITILALKIKDDKDSVGTIQLKVDDDSMIAAKEFADKFCDKYELNSKLRRRMLVIIDEIYSNIIRYSGANNCTITIQERKGMISMSFEDDGIYYNPLEKEAPDITLSAEEREIGGLGIFMVTKMAEDIKYGRINACNYLDIIL